LPLGGGDAVGLAVVGFGRGGCVLGHRCGQPGWWVAPRVEVAAIGGATADRHEVPDLPAQHLGDRAEAAVGDDGGVPRLGADRRGERVVVANIGVDVAVPVDFGELVTAGVADRDVMAARGEAGHDGRPRWSRPSDDEGLHSVAV